MVGIDRFCSIIIFCRRKDRVGMMCVASGLNTGYEEINQSWYASVTNRSHLKKAPPLSTPPFT
jgi:hypothetical protein